MPHSDESARLDALERELVQLKAAYSSRGSPRRRDGWRSRARYLLIFSGVLALTITGVATGVTGGTVEEGVRNPTTGFITGETQLMADHSEFAARISNFRSGDGGGIASGCRSPVANEPCLLVGNILDGHAFQFATNGSVGGVINVAGPNARPFTTNAPEVATGFNADKLDGFDAADLQDASEPATVGAHWGPMPRNTIGSPVEELRNGPFVPGSPGDPPHGVGSLGLEVAVGPDATLTGDEKATFGNEVDFLGDDVAAINEVGFHVFTTGENNAISPSNLPNITFEVDPTGLDEGSGPNYSSMVFVPNDPPSPPNVWSDYIDGTDGAQGGWYFTNGTTASTTGCSQSSFCSFSSMQNAIAANYPSMDVLTLAIGKGRDNPWQGAVDGLRYNDDIFDFEIFGVRTEEAAPPT